jgi:chitinase
MNIFPAQGNGYPGVNFGNACYGDPVYVGPGSDHTEDHLYQRCPTVQEDIPYCQANGKKILLSLGGGTDTYGVNGVVEGNYFAEFLWGAYGPYKSAWVEAGGLRPLDRGYDNTAACEHIDIDGFDFDIEFPSTGKFHVPWRWI